MSEATRIYYHGNKAVKRDNIIRDSGRVWNGYGSHQDVAPTEAAKYLQYADVWTEQKPTGKAIATAPAPVDPNADSTQSGGDETIDDRMRDIIEAVQRLDPNDKADYTGSGKPRVNRVVELAGFSVEAAEITDAINYLKSLEAE